MNFFKKIFLIIVTFLVTISLSTLFIGCPPKPTEEIIEKTIEEITITEEIEETTIESAEEEIEEDKAKEIIQDFYVGEILVAENFCEFTIHSVENYEPKYPDWHEENFRLISIDIEIKNISNEMQRYRRSNYEAQDSDRYVYGYEFSDEKEPSFGTGDIASGQIRRGWVTIPVKEDAEIVAIIAQPFKSSPTTIKLHKPLKP